MNIEQKAYKMLKAASEQMHELVHETQQLLDENTKLRQELEVIKSAAANKVTLEKVAKVNEEDARTFASLLISHSILPESDFEKCANACVENPNSAIKIAIHALKSSELPEETGRGIKSAGAKKLSRADLNRESDVLYSNFFATVNY